MSSIPSVGSGSGVIKGDLSCSTGESGGEIGLKRGELNSGVSADGSVTSIATKIRSKLKVR